MCAQEATMTAPGTRLPGRRVLPRRSVRARLTALYSALFLLSGAVLLAITGGVGASVWSVTHASSAAPGSTQPPAEAAHIQAAVSHSLIVGSAVALGVMTVVSLVLGWIVAGRVLRPLREMTAAAQRISEDNLHERLAMHGPDDELKDLADTIDGLLERLEAAFAAQRRFVANASHELRTPLTTMLACVDVAVAKHNTDGGWISATTGSDGRLACLVVETGGDVLDPQQVGQLAQPFRRLRADRTGSDNGAGLGLSIVAAIASAHRGTLDLQARPGGGLRVAIALPLATEAVPAGVLA